MRLPSLLLGIALIGSTLAVPARAEPLPGIAVVELFTSEGCSSCPPAEALLNLLDKEAHAGGKPVYALAFHVDYWNYLGWDDRFADAAFAERQRRYAHALSEGRAYTPQMVVNGREAFVGSDGRKADAAIGRALDRPAKTRVAVAAALHDGAVRATVDVALPAGHQIIVALVEHELQSDVKRGENRGRKLVHRAVVRALASTAAPGIVALDVPKDAARGKLEVIAFVQHGKTLEIVGAARARLAHR